MSPALKIPAKKHMIKKTTTIVVTIVNIMIDLIVASNIVDFIVAGSTTRKTRNKRKYMNIMKLLQNRRKHHYQLSFISFSFSSDSLMISM